MPPKRKYNRDLEDSSQAKLTYASELRWLDCLTRDDEEYSPCDEVIENDMNTDLIIEACKLVYILYHNVEADGRLGSIVRSLNKSLSAQNAELVEVARRKQSRWKTQILNKFFLPHVTEMERKWRVANPYADFAAVSQPERIKIWMNEYDADPKKMVFDMFRPVIKTLDLYNLFGKDLAGEDGEKMGAMRAMLRRKYWFGCDCTYKHTIVKKNKRETLEDWAAYGSFDSMASTIVPFADVPISSYTPAIASSQKKKAKKARTEAAPEDDFEDFSAATSQYPPKLPALPVNTPFRPPEKQPGPEQRGDTPHSPSASRTSSVSRSLPAIQSYGGAQEHSISGLSSSASPPSPSFVQNSEQQQNSQSLGSSRDLTSQNTSTPTPSSAASSSEIANIRKLFNISEEAQPASPTLSELIAGIESANDDDLL